MDNSLCFKQRQMEKRAGILARLGSGQFPFLLLALTLISLSPVLAESITITPVNISGFNESNVFECSFYLENATCTEMRNRCQTEATQVLIQANFGLQGELKQAEEKNKKIIISNSFVFIFLVCVVIYLILNPLNLEKIKTRFKKN